MKILKAVTSALVLMEFVDNFCIRQRFIGEGKVLR